MTARQDYHPPRPYVPVVGYLGLDVGTTGCKAVVFDERGKPLSRAYRDYRVDSPYEGWAELDSAEVCGKSLEAIREAAGAAGEPVRGIGISSQGEAFTPIGPDGRFLANGMVSSDARAAAIAERFSEEFGRERLYRNTGHTPSPLFTLFKMLWLSENRPDIWERAASFYCFEELIHHSLGLEPAISWPLAGRTMLFDVTKHEWSGDICSRIGLDPGKLARTLPSGAVVGEVPAARAKELGLQDGVIVVTGGHDQTCAALGAGVVSPGRAAYGIGTVECITPAFAAPVFGDELMRNNLATYDFTVRGMYTTVAYSLTGGNLLQWYRDNFAHKEAQAAGELGKDVYEVILDAMPDAPTNLLFLPYLTPSGTPYFETRVPGALLGLRLTTTREEVLRGFLEGVTYEMRLNLEILKRSGMPVDELLATGGGAKSRKWLQIKADILNTPISVVSVTEAGCLGAAMLACAADMQTDVGDIAPEWVSVSDTVEPDAANAAIYDERFAGYLEFYPALKGLYERIDAR